MNSERKILDALLYIYGDDLARYIRENPTGVEESLRTVMENLGLGLAHLRNRGNVESTTD